MAHVNNHQLNGLSIPLGPPSSDNSGQNINSGPQHRRRVEPVPATLPPSWAPSNGIPERSMDFQYLAARYQDTGEELDWDALDGNQSDKIDESDVSEESEESDGSEEDDENDRMGKPESNTRESRFDPSELQDSGRRRKRQPLSRTRVTEIINEQIQQYEDQWFPGKGWTDDNQIAYDGKELWHEAEASGERQRLIDATNDQINHYKEQLYRLCEYGIAKESWANQERLKRQCRALQVTIENLLQEEWELSVYNLPSPPSPLADSTEDSIAARQTCTSGEVIELYSDSTMSDNEVREPMSQQQNLVRPLVSTVSTQQSRSVIPLLGSSTKHPSRAFTSLSLSKPPEDMEVHTELVLRQAGVPDRTDRERLLLRVLRSMRAENRELIRTRLVNVSQRDLHTELKKCISMIVWGETRIQGVLPRDLHKIMKHTRLFLCWWYGDDFFDPPDLPQRSQLQELLKWMMDERAHRPEDATIAFGNQTRDILARDFSKEAMRRQTLNQSRSSGGDAVIILSSDEE